MKILFTKHAIEKLVAYEGGSIRISAEDLIQTITKPDIVDTRSRMPEYIAQKHLDTTHVLRVIYAVETERKEIRIITFYPGRKSKYEKKK